MSFSPRTRSPFLLERWQGGPLRTAHGGASRLAPDNTLEAIEAATHFPFDLVEVDVHLTRDGELLLWHDPQLVTPDGSFEIASHTLADLRALEVPDGTLATLAQAAEVVRGHCGLMIDLKAPELEDPILGVLQQANFTDAVVCGGYLGTLEALKAQLPQIGVSLTPGPAFYRDFASGLRTVPFIDAVTVYWRAVGPGLMQATTDAGVLTLAWTVDHRQIADHVLAQGVHGLTSNNMDVLQALRPERAAL